MRLFKGCLAAFVPAFAVIGGVWLANAHLAKRPAETGYWMERRLAAAALAGSDVLFPAQTDEARLRWNIADQIEEAPAVAVLGSSHGLQIASSHVAPYSLHNFCISGGSLADHLITTEILLARDKTPSVWAIIVDPWYFDVHTDFLMWKARPEELRKMETRLSEMEASELPRIFRDRVSQVSERRIETGYSITPLQSAADNLARKHLGSVVVVETDEILGTVLRSDGSIHSPTKRIIDPQEVRDLAARQFTHNRDRHRYGTYPLIDDGLWAIFERWIRFLEGKGSRVVLILTPYHPHIFDRIVADTNNQLRAIEQRVRTMAGARNLLVVGSYDPIIAGVTGHHFTDGDHLNAAGLATLLGTKLTEVARAEEKPAAGPAGAAAP